MRIDIWSDFVCPWCWIGKQRLRRGIALLGADAPTLEIYWHPFLLDPAATTESISLKSAYVSKFGGTERMQKILAHTQRTARAEGLAMDFSRGQVRVTTLPAHRLVALAAREGMDVDAINEALFHAYFAQGQNLADINTLILAGSAGGINADRIRRLFASDSDLADINAELTQATDIGIQAIPTYVLNERYMLQGAQPPASFADTIRDASRDQNASTDIGNACGPEGCEL